MKNKKRRDLPRFVLINGRAYRREPGGMVRVDAYYVPRKEAADYIARREVCAAAAMEAMSTWCVRVERGWAGFEDGEAVLGMDQDGVLIALVHLDPQAVDEMSDAIRQGCLKEYLQEINAA